MLIDYDPQGDLTASLGWKNSDEMNNTIAKVMDASIRDIDIDFEDIILHHSEEQVMGVRKRPSKKSKNGYVYEVFFQYKDEYGCNKRFTKSRFLSKKEAKEYETIKMAELVEGDELLKDKDKTFNDVFNEYMSVEGMKYSRSTRQYYEKSFKSYVEKTIGEYMIRNLKYRHLQKFYNEINAGYATVRNIKKILGVTFTYAQKNNYIRENPMKLATITKEDKKEKKPKVISKDELDTIINNILVSNKHSPNKEYIGRNNKAFAIAIFIGWYTGLRLSETLGLMKEDFDFENNEITVCRRLEYHNLNKEDLYVTDKLKTKAAIIRYVSYNLGIDFHYYMLRHSFTTQLIKNGVSPAVTKELVRHSDIKTTFNVYTHIGKEDMKNAILNVFD